MANEKKIKLDQIEDIGEMKSLSPSTPTDGTFLDGLFQWTDNTKIVDAFDDLNELAKALAPPPAPSLSNFSTTNLSSHVDGNLSFDESNPIAGQDYTGTNVGDDPGVGGPSPNIVLIDELWDKNVDANSLNKRMGIVATSGGDLTGILNDQVLVHPGIPNASFPANSFGGGDQGTLRMYLNGTEILSAAIDLTNLAAQDTTSSGTLSGFNLSIATDVLFASGSPFAAFKYRTGTWLIKDTQTGIRQGYNYVTIIHDKAPQQVLDRLEFIVDDNTTATSYSSPSLFNLNITGSKKLSGIDYHIMGSAQYDVTIDNAYRNTYSNSNSAISFTSNSNSYGTLLSANSLSLINCVGDESKQLILVSDYLPVIASINANRRLLNETISLTCNVQRTVQANSSGGTDSIDNILFDNFPASSTLVLEKFDDENHRLNTNSNYDLTTDVTAGGNQWDSDQSLNDGSAGHTTGLQVTDGKLIYPNTAGGSLDYRTSNILNGSAFNNGGTGGSARNYTALTGNRTYYRYFRQVAPTVGNFVMNIAGSGGTFVPVTDTATSNWIHVEIKGPTQTGWMDAYENFATNQWADGNGARNDGAGAGRAFGTNWGLTIGTKSTASTDGYMMLRITVGPNFTGNFTNITWSFG